VFSGRDECDAGRSECDDLAVAASRDDLPVLERAGSARTDPGGHDHHPVLGEKLDVHGGARPELAPAGSEDRPGDSRLEARPNADRTSLGQQ
jgi:hypothetical protein